MRNSGDFSLLHSQGFLSWPSWSNYIYHVWDPLPLKFFWEMPLMLMEFICLSCEKLSWKLSTLEHPGNIGCFYFSHLSQSFAELDHFLHFLAPKDLSTTSTKDWIKLPSICWIISKLLGTHSDWLDPFLLIILSLLTFASRFQINAIHIIACISLVIFLFLLYIIFNRLQTSSLSGSRKWSLRISKTFANVKSDIPKLIIKTIY